MDYLYTLMALAMVSVSVHGFSLEGNAVLSREKRQTGASCISSCRGLPNGDYQSCVSCRFYATCDNGLLRDRRECPPRQIWDDNLKQCEFNSPTCTLPTSMTTTSATTTSATTTIPTSPTPFVNPCITSCSGRSTGNYQWCQTCKKYLTCTSNNMYVRDCPPFLMWDNNKQRCEETSTTCVEPTTTTSATTTSATTTSATTTSPTTTSPTPYVNPCITSCSGRVDGDYQSCVSCNVYATCFQGHLRDNRPCPAATSWDDNLKQCTGLSTTCF
ncbi:chitin-binding domain protein cbd-1-like [Haliotis rufescens]|uniref:chitin-binding domain protein cbd-1-like n=1 Tax=Haliotis rufescens TaxID=6454 RepID=UPI001EAFA07D|nr:chitin-binding domain protein cbd-1-like [Haliotis rufescens]